MKVFIVLSIISIVLLSGCTAQVVEKELNKKTQPPPIETKEPTGTLPNPQITATKGATEETKITTDTTVNVTKAPEELSPSPSPQPKTFNINIVEGIGIREGSG